MKTDAVVVRLELPWWAFVYANTCMVFARLHGLTPDLDKISTTIIRHVRVRIV